MVLWVLQNDSSQTRLRLRDGAAGILDGLLVVAIDVVSLLEGQGDLVSRLIMGSLGLLCYMGYRGINLLTWTP